MAIPTFRFQNPTTKYQQTYNAVLDQYGPEVAVSWATNPMSYMAEGMGGMQSLNDWKTAIDASLGGSYGNSLINLMNEPGPTPWTVPAYSGFNLPQGWTPPGWSWTTPGEFTYQGKTYNIPSNIGGGGTTTGGGGTTPPVINPNPPPTTGGGGTTTGGGGGTVYNPPAAGTNAYSAIASLLPGYGLSQTLNGFGIPGFDSGPTKAGGSWAGTTFNPAQYSGLAENPIPGTDPYAEYRARHGIGSTGTGTGTTTTGGAGTGGTRLDIGQTDPFTNLQIVGYDGNGNYLVSNPGGGEDPKASVITGGHYGDISGAITSGGTANANPRTNWLGVPITNEGWAINQAAPWQTTWYLQTYGGKKAPFLNIHEQIGKAMEGNPAAMPTFNWAGPGAMAAAQPSASGFPPGGWTQMLGFTPGMPSNYGFLGGRPNPYGYTNTPLVPSLAAG